MSEQKRIDMSQHFYRASATDFMKIPGNPVAYWVGKKTLKALDNSINLGEFSDARMGLATGNNARYMRTWHELARENIGIGFQNRETAKESELRWFPYCKGGQFRKWYGNNEYVVDWKNDGYELQNTLHPSGSRIWAHNFNLDHIFEDSLTWSDITSGHLSVRFNNTGFLFDGSGTCAFFKNENEKLASLGFLNTQFSKEFSKVLNPTLHFQTGDYRNMPFNKKLLNDTYIEVTKNLITKARKDWDSYETSWDFTYLPLLTQDARKPTISSCYEKTRAQWLRETKETQRLEEENNRIFNNIYGLQDELTSEVPLKEITLTCNPHYRYGGDLTEQEREDRLQSDTIAELLSYAIGCMMGRYSLDREGLVYAHAGNQGFADLVVEGAYKTFDADDDGILPLTEQEWFSDDVTNRLSEFVSTVWGEQQLEENLQFIADSLCLYALKTKKGERALDTIRRYLSNQFYKDHLRTYKRRPIYWLFSSGKHKAFECLVYLHRYHEGTLARMRAEYVIPLSSRINARINRLSEEADAADSTAERNQINRELKTLHNQQAELATFDEQLRHHADMRITLDLDDGVKENYGKFGNLLDSVKAVTGQAAE
ncbi:MAG: BREX-1 system adenine-specific DNA-methyltransferase PglX [Pseudomonas sp.]|nr:BREX-1 system adenine-specific DNA-methyltransferase PglX [Pseudomonas sp.]